MRVVLSAALAVALMTAAVTSAETGRQEVAEAAPPDSGASGPPSHFLPRPSQLMQAFGNYMHQHHQDTAAAHHATHSNHHVQAHGARPPTDVPVAAAAAAAAAEAAGAAAGAPPPYPPPTPLGPQPPHVNPPNQSLIASHLQQLGIGQGERPGLLGGMGGLLGGHHILPPRPITATRTVFVEVTKRVTRHPVCMTVYGERPPCLPYNEYKPSPYKKPIDDYRHAEKKHEPEQTYRYEEDDDFDYSDMSEGLYINPTQVMRMGEATAVVDSMFPRYGRYIQLAPRSPAATLADPAKSDDVGVATPVLENAAVEAPAMEQRQNPFTGIGAGISQLASNMGSMMPQMPMGPMGPPRPTQETRYELKTLWVTKVERFTDYRVTATLVAENCVPTDSKIPFCKSGYSGPNYEGSDDYTPIYTNKPTIITTPKPPKKPGYDYPAPPHARPHRPIIQRRPPPPPPTTPRPVYTTPAPPPPYAPVAYPPPPPPPAVPAYPTAPPPPAPYTPAPTYAPLPVAPPQYVPPQSYPPPPEESEPVHDYPVDTHRQEHWKETDEAQSQEMAMEAPSE